MNISINELLNTIRITEENSYTQDTVIMSIDSTPIATLGNISASVGKAKSGKTFNVSSLVSAALANSTILKFSANMPSEKRKILYVDTEQSRYHCCKVLHRIANLSNVNNLYLKENLYLLSVREYSSDKRVYIIDKVLKEINNIGLLIIDGCRDLLRDINCPVESSNLINQLMEWSSKYNLHIHVVLHQNKNDENTRGHLGTELNNKAETILHVSKIHKDSIQCLVRPLFTRDIEFTSFTFGINELGIPILADSNKVQIIKKREFKLEEITEEQHQQALSAAFRQETIFGYENLINKIKEGYATIGFEFGNNKIKLLNKFLKDNNVITREGKGYIFNKGFNVIK